MAADWQVTLTVADVSGSSLTGVQLVTSVFSGGAVDRRPVSIVNQAVSILAPSTALGIVLEFRHSRYAPLALSLVRESGEAVWRWSNAEQVVSTVGLKVAVNAVMPRLRPASTVFRSEAELSSAADSAWAPVVAKAMAAIKGAKGKAPILPGFVVADNELSGPLVLEDRSAYRSTVLSNNVIGNQGKIAQFHLPQAELVGRDASADGWARFASKTVAVDPAQGGQLFLVEYGEVGDSPSGPRYLVAVWVPAALLAPSVRQRDAIVWLHPHTSNPTRFPQMQYPFTKPYPYFLAAVPGTPVTKADPVQKFVDLGIYHLLFQHYLAYHALASAKNAMVIVPVIPSSHFEILTSPVTLMRLIRELCRWLPKTFPRGTQARVHAPPPTVGRVGVAGFSASVPFMGQLMTTRSAAAQYRDPVWGLDADGKAFADVWREQWAIDGVAAGFEAYLDTAAGWVQSGSERRLRVYKSDFTAGAGHWRPTQSGNGPWHRMAGGARLVERSSGKRWAQVAGDAQGRWQAASFSNAFLLGMPPMPGKPAIHPLFTVDGPHEMMPRICFGHAFATSGFS